MKIQIYDKIRNRSLSANELEEQYYFTGNIHKDREGEWEDTNDFKVNLKTLKVQIFNKNEVEWQDNDSFEVKLSK